jgi:hypothetical protein
MNLIADNYFEGLSNVHAAIVARLNHAQAVPANRTADEAASDTFAGGVTYGATVSEHIELATLKGRPTRKYAHAVVYRMESGRYELTFYIL